MHPLLWLALGLVLGGAVGVLVVRVLTRGQRPDPTGPAPDYLPGSPTPVDDETVLARRLLDLMDPAVVLLDLYDSVLLANPSARALGIVRGSRLLVPGLVSVAHEVRRSGSRRSDVQLPGDLVGTGPRMVGVHGVRLDSGPAPAAAFDVPAQR